MLPTKRFVFCACSSIESKVSRVVPLELPVFFHQEVEGLHVLFYAAVSAFPYRLIVPGDIGVDPSAGGFAIKSLTRCLVHPVSATWSANRSLLNSQRIYFERLRWHSGNLGMLTVVGKFGGQL